MQEFLKITRSEPGKREAGERVRDYREIYELLGSDEMREQSSRCIQCGDPFCHSKCPLHNLIPFWLRALGEKDDLDLAFALSNETNPFPEITGRVCPQERLCEGDCSLSDGHGAITIGSIELAISERGFAKGLKPKFAPLNSGKSVAVVGSGPASIAAATYLMRSGVKVTMYEKQSRAGGLLTYGIPGFKIEKDVVARRIAWLVEAGMELKTSVKVGEDLSFAQLANTHNAVFLGLGAEQSNRAGISGENAKGTMMAIDFLRAIQKKNFKEKHDEIEVAGKNVVVIGGGDTAMDCLRTSIREGAKSVTCLYRRDKFNMPGSKKEFKNALDEGVNFVYNAAPKEVIVSDEGNVLGVNMLRTIMSEKGADGRQSVEIMKGSDFRVDADLVIFALGFTPENPTFLAENGIEVNSRGAIQTENYRTSKAGIYAGGDCVRGAALVVNAAADGREAAKVIVKDFGL
jgi:glutamate synthase (NADPH/NADH) small chain